MKLILIFALMISSTSFAEKQSSTKNDPKSVQEIVKEGKSSRRKKVEMCHDCGKPESHCDCPEEVRKKEQEAKRNQ